MPSTKCALCRSGVRSRELDWNVSAAPGPSRVHPWTSEVPLNIWMHMRGDGDRKRQRGIARALPDLSTPAGVVDREVGGTCTAEKGFVRHREVDVGIASNAANGGAADCLRTIGGGNRARAVRLDRDREPSPCRTLEALEIHADLRLRLPRADHGPESGIRRALGPFQPPEM